MPTLERGCTRPCCRAHERVNPSVPRPIVKGRQIRIDRTPRGIEEAACVPGGFPEGAGPGGVGGQTGPRGCAVRAHVEKSVAVRLYIVPPAPRSPWSTKIRKAEIASAWRRGRCAPLTHHGLVLDVSIRDDTIRLGQALKLARLAGSGGEAAR
jgi:S4 domain